MTLLERLNSHSDPGDRVFADEAYPSCVQVLDEVIGQWRHGCECRRVIRFDSGRLFMIYYRTQPDEGVVDADEWYQVEEVTHTITDYKAVQ